MNHHNDSNGFGEKQANDVPAYQSGAHEKHDTPGGQFNTDPEGRGIVVSGQNALHKDLKGRHMQMIAM